MRRPPRPAVGIGNAYAGRQSFAARIRSEVMVVAAVLLHDKHKVLDFFQARWSGGRRGILRGRPARNYKDCQRHRQQREAGPDAGFQVHHLIKPAAAAELLRQWWILQKSEMELLTDGQAIKHAPPLRRL